MAIISEQLHDNYATSPWSQFTRAMRHANNDQSGANYATFWFQLALGGPIYQSTSPSGQYHSEKMVWQAIKNFAPLSSILVPSWPAGQVLGAWRTADAALAATGGRILCVYTEREPCGGCTPMLNSVTPHPTYVYWHFTYASEETGKYKHDPKSTALFALDQLKYGSYSASKEKDTRKDSRKSGNAEHKSEMKGMGTTWADGPPPVSVAAPAA